MKKILSIICMMALMVTSTTIFADVKKAEKKKSRALEGTVKTRIGELKFVMGYPSDATNKESTPTGGGIELTPGRG